MDQARFGEDGCRGCKGVEGEVSPISSCRMAYCVRLPLINRRIGCTRYVGPQIRGTAILV